MALLYLIFNLHHYMDIMDFSNIWMFLRFTYEMKNGDLWSKC